MFRLGGHLAMCVKRRESLFADEREWSKHEREAQILLRIRCVSGTISFNSFRTQLNSSAYSQETKRDWWKRQSRDVDPAARVQSPACWCDITLPRHSRAGWGDPGLSEQSTGFLIKRFPHLAWGLSELSAFGYYKEDQFLPLNSPPLPKKFHGFQFPAAQKSCSTAVPPSFTPLVPG